MLQWWLIRFTNNFIFPVTGLYFNNLVSSLLHLWMYTLCKVWFNVFWTNYNEMFILLQRMSRSSTCKNDTPSAVMDSSRSFIFIFNSWALAILSFPWLAFSASLIASCRNDSSLCRKSSRICSNSVVIWSCKAHSWL